jgi:hypothetical protein
MDWTTASRVFLCLTVILFGIGCHRLGAAIHGHPTWLAIPCSFFVYNSMLLYGFVNYVFSLGCFCVTLGYWLRRRHGWTPRQLAVATILTFLTYIAHLGAYSFLGAAFVTIGAWDLWKDRTGRSDVAFALVPLLPEVILYIAQTLERGGPGRVEWNSVSGKLIALLPLFLTYDHRFDLVFLLVLSALCGAALLASEECKIVWPSFMAGIVLLALLVACPRFMLTSSGADGRFFPPAALLLVLSVKAAWRPRAAGILFVACLALFSVRVGSIWVNWRQMDRQVAAQIAFFSILPEGARVYPAFPSPELVPLSKRERSLEHVISLATITRHAYVVSQFSNPAGQPVLFRRQPVYLRLADQPEKWIPSIEAAEYVWSYGMPASAEAVLASRCVALGERDGFTIWQVNR